MTYILYKNDLPDNSPLFAAPALAIDSETMGLHLFANRLCLLQLSAGDGVAHLVKFSDDKYHCPNVKKLLKNGKTQKIFHFARFDLAMIAMQLGVMPRNIYCTRTASRIVRRYGGKHGLKDLCQELLNVELNKEQQSSYWGGEQLSEKQCIYAADDVLYLHRLRDILNEMAAREGKTALLASANGFLTSRVALDLAGIDDDIFAHS